MADEVVKAVCPKCQIVYELPAEYVGQMGECTECGSVFEITGHDRIPEGVHAGGGLQSTDDPYGDASVPEEQQYVEPEPEAQTFVPPPEMTSTQSVPKGMDETDSAISKADLGQTNTVKLSRAKVGMVPTLKDDFKVGLLQSPRPQVTSTNNSLKHKTFTATRTNHSGIGKQMPAPKKKHWWEFWK